MPSHRIRKVDFFLQINGLGNNVCVIHDTPLYEKKKDLFENRTIVSIFYLYDDSQVEILHMTGIIIANECVFRAPIFFRK